MSSMQRRATTLAIAACLAYGLPAVVRAQTASVTLASVLDALRSGQNEAALRLSAELLRAEPRSEKAWTLRAAALEQSNERDQALAAYQHALTLAPQYLPALEGAAQLSYKARSTQAAQLLHRIVALQPANQTAHAMLAALEYRNNDYATAAEDFDAAADALRAHPDALMEFALCLVRLNRPADAIAHFQQVLALRPDDASARYDLALVQWRSDAPAEALSTLQPQVDAHTADSRMLRLAANIHEASNETPQAVELLRAAILADPEDADNYLTFATLSFTHNSFQVGVDMVNLGLTRLPDSAPLYMARGVLYGQNGDFEKAMADFEHAHQLDPNSTMAVSAEGIAQSQLHHQQAALEDFRRQVREHPRDALAWYLLAEALSWSGSEAKAATATSNVTEAIAMAHESIALDPHRAATEDLLATLELQAGHTALAVKACNAALAINPRDQQAVYSLLMAQRKTGSPQELRGLVQKLTDLRKADNAENLRMSRYGQLVESP